MVSHHMWLEDNFQEIFVFPSSGEFCQSSGLHSKSSYPLSHLSRYKGWTPKVGVTPKSAAGTEPGEPQSCCLCEIYLGGLFWTPGFCAVLLLPPHMTLTFLYYILEFSLWSAHCLIVDNSMTHIFPTVRVRGIFLILSSLTELSFKSTFNCVMLSHP